MKFNKMLIALALCAVMLSNISFGSDFSQEEGPAPVSQSYYQQAKDYTASWVPQSVKDSSVKEKLAVGSLLLVALVGYNLMMQNAPLPSSSAPLLSPTVPLSQPKSEYFKSLKWGMSGGVGGGLAGGMVSGAIARATFKPAVVVAEMFMPVFLPGAEGQAMTAILRGTLRRGIIRGAVFGASRGGFLGGVGGASLGLAMDIIDYFSQKNIE